MPPLLMFDEVNEAASFLRSSVVTLINGCAMSQVAGRRRLGLEVGVEREGMARGSERARQTMTRQEGGNSH